MKLKFNRQVSGAAVTVVLTLANITIRERRAMKALGYPEIQFEEAYDVSGTTVDIDTTVDQFNDLGAFTFKGTVETIPDILDEVESFITSIEEVLSEAMTDLMMAYQEIEDTANDVTGEKTIVDGVCHTDTTTTSEISTSDDDESDSESSSAS